MGNKTNATGLRIGINKNWKSVWYKDKGDYADTLLQDIKIRDLVHNSLKSAQVAGVMIKRAMTKVTIDIRVARPGVVIGKQGAGIEKLKKELDHIVKTPVQINVFEVKRPEIEARLVAENIASQCERRIAPKIAIRRVMEAARATGLIEGMMVEVSGRIRGAEIARVERDKWQSVPKHTLRANIDYAFVEAQVPGAGKHGIKVWINKGEKQDYELAA